MKTKMKMMMMMMPHNRTELLMPCRRRLGPKPNIPIPNRNKLCSGKTNNIKPGGCKANKADKAYKDKPGSGQCAQNKRV